MEISYPSFKADPTLMISAHQIHPWGIMGKQNHINQLNIIIRGSRILCMSEPVDFFSILSIDLENILRPTLNFQTLLVSNSTQEETIVPTSINSYINHNFLHLCKQRHDDLYMF